MGYIGPNGSGKSTTIKMMSGILLPDEGTIRVNGVDPFYQRKQNGRNIGVLFGRRSQLWWHLKLEDTLNLLRHMYDIPDAQYAARLSMLRKTLSLDEFWGQPIRQLSLGQRMRGELAAALIHSPSNLPYLDEPTIGMDVIVKESIRDLLKLIHQRDGYHHSAHHPRPGRRGAHLFQGGRHQPRPIVLRRLHGASAGTVRLRSPRSPSCLPRKRRSCPISCAT